MSTTNEREKRQSIIDACRSMNALGINQGTSGNISLRHSTGLLITPTSVPYETMHPSRSCSWGSTARSTPLSGPPASGGFTWIY